MSWNDERVETLKKLWGEGFSASQIAAQLGGVTRNAVIGKVHRLGLAGRGNTALAQAYDIEFEPEPELSNNVIPLGQRRSLLELTENTCRWPIGDPGNPDFFFSGGQTISSLPYCAYHARLAYQPPNPRRDRRAFKA